MLRTKCPVYEQNKKAHEHFLNYYKQFRVQFKTTENRLSMLKEFHGVLIKWLANHIMKIDMNLKTQKQELVEA